MDPEPRTAGRAAGFIFSAMIRRVNIWEMAVSIKSIVIFLLIVGGVVWFMQKQTQEPPIKPVNLLEGQQKQMQKASNLGKQMQDDLDKRMQSVPSAD